MAAICLPNCGAGQSLQSQNRGDMSEPEKPSPEQWREKLANEFGYDLETIQPITPEQAEKLAKGEIAINHTVLRLRALAK
jgi:hypothetical protein